MTQKASKSRIEPKEKKDGSLKAKGSSKRSISCDSTIKVVPSSPRGFCGPPGPSRDAVLRDRSVGFEGIVIFNQDESLAGAASPKSVKGDVEPSILETCRSMSTGAKKRGGGKKRKGGAPVTKPEEFKFATQKRKAKRERPGIGPPPLMVGRPAAKARIALRSSAFGAADRLQCPQNTVSLDGTSDHAPLAADSEDRNPNQARHDISVLEKSQERQRQLTQQNLSVEVPAREQRKPPFASIEVPRWEPFSPSSPQAPFTAVQSSRGSRANNASSRESSANCTLSAHPIPTYPVRHAPLGSPRPSSSGSSSSAGSRDRAVESLPLLPVSSPPSSSSSGDPAGGLDSPRLSRNLVRHSRVANPPSARIIPHSPVDDPKPGSLSKFKEEMAKLDHHEKNASRTGSVPPRETPRTPPQEAQKRALSHGRGRRNSNSPEDKEELSEKKTVRFFLEQNVEVLRFDEEPDLLGFGGSCAVPARASRRVFGGEFCQNLGAPVGHPPSSGRMISVDRSHPPRLPVMSSMMDRPSQRPGIRDLHTTPPGHS